MAFIAGIPAYNEEKHIRLVLTEIGCCVRDIVVVDDGSTDATSQLLCELAREMPGLVNIRHPKNEGYGKSLADIFDYAIRNHFEYLVTLDGDEQHLPADVLGFVLEADKADIVSGSRYHPESRMEGLAPPPERRRIGMEIVQRINEITGYGLTDAFCGFKAYRVEALKKLHLTDTSYGMPIQLWMQAWKAGLRVEEMPVVLKYLDPGRKFGGHLDDAEVRRRYYHEIIDREMAEKAG